MTPEPEHVGTRGSGPGNRTRTPRAGPAAFGDIRTDMFSLPAAPRE